jgi:hypothetical protein
MIHQIKKEIILHKQDFGIDNFEEGDIFVSKFFHGNPATNNKIIFYISVFSKPLCILKISRASTSNSIIEREEKGMGTFESEGLLVPKVFFTGDILGNKYICEELVNALPVGKYNETSAFSLVSEYHKSIKKGKYIRLGDIIEKVKSLSIHSDPEFSSVLDLLSVYKDDGVYFANQHGDLTCRNIFIKDDKLIFIDLENFGLRAFWGGDVVHYLTRIFDTSTLSDIGQRAKDFVKNTTKFRSEYVLDISDKECQIFYLVDFLFEILQKNHPEISSETACLMSNIWSE